MPARKKVRWFCCKGSGWWLQVGQFDEMVKYLMMVRDKVKDPKVDTEIVIAYAMTDKLGDLEAFITGAAPVSLFVHRFLSARHCLCDDRQPWRTRSLYHRYGTSPCFCFSPSLCRLLSAWHCVRNDQQAR